LLFFSGCGLTIWVVWIAMQTGFPAQPAANVARLAPGFEAGFSVLAFTFAVAATLVWAWLVQWRVGRHRAAIWKSLVLPAGGAALCWLLLMTLWMPLLNYAQSYNAMVRQAVAQMDPPGCVEVVGLGEGKVAAFQFYGNLTLKPLRRKPECPWLIAQPSIDMAPPAALNVSAWVLQTAIRHPTDGNETVLVFRRR
jgi:4-amino-4-deoxy-L-arabinose transferase-like glycosyltransferase